MDEHGPDAPDSVRITAIGGGAVTGCAGSGGTVTITGNIEQRRYLPTLADLVDRLTIVMLKQVNISHALYAQERADIEHDIDIVCREMAVLDSPGKSIAAIAVVMLANKTIWDNESLARQGSDKQNDLLRFTHSINGIRNRAKNVIAKAAGERVDLKVDCFAADLPKEFGQWDGII